MPRHKALADALSFPAELLVKFFKMGDHVKVVGGSNHVGETGMVIRVGEAKDGSSKDAAGDTTLYIFSDLSQSEFSVRSTDVQECADVSAGLERLGSYELYDLVLLDRTSAGVIVKVEHSSFKVADLVSPRRLPYSRDAPV